MSAAPPPPPQIIMVGGGNRPAPASTNTIPAWAWVLVAIIIIGFGILIALKWKGQTCTPKDSDKVANANTYVYNKTSFVSNCVVSNCLDGYNLLNGICSQDITDNGGDDAATKCTGQTPIGNITSWTYDSTTGVCTAICNSGYTGTNCETGPGPDDGSDPSLECTSKVIPNSAKGSWIYDNSKTPPTCTLQCSDDFTGTNCDTGPAGTPPVDNRKDNCINQPASTFISGYSYDGITDTCTAICTPSTRTGPNCATEPVVGATCQQGYWGPTCSETVPDPQTATYFPVGNPVTSFKYSLKKGGTGSMPTYNATGYIFGISSDTTAGLYQVNSKDTLPVKSVTKMYEITTTGDANMFACADTGVVTFGLNTFTPTFPVPALSVNSTNITSTFKSYRFSDNGNLYMKFTLPGASYAEMGITRSDLFSTNGLRKSITLSGTAAPAATPACNPGYWGPTCVTYVKPTDGLNIFSVSLPYAATSYTLQSTFPKVISAMPYVFGQTTTGFGVWKLDGTVPQKVWEVPNISYTADGALTLGNKVFTPDLKTTALSTYTNSKEYKILYLLNTGDIQFTFFIGTKGFRPQSMIWSSYTITPDMVLNGADSQSIRVSDFIK